MIFYFLFFIFFGMVTCFSEVSMPLSIFLNREVWQVICAVHPIFYDESMIRETNLA